MSGGADLADAAARRRRSPARPDIRARHAAVGVRRAIAIACILGCLAGGGRRAHAEEVPGADALADAFVAMAGGSEYGARAEGIVRWEVPLLEIAVIGAPTQDQRAALGALLPQLTAATGLGIEEVPPPVSARAPIAPVPGAIPGAGGGGAERDELGLVKMPVRQVGWERRCWRWVGAGNRGLR
jgi:hypothetical protein